MTPGLTYHMWSDQMTRFVQLMVEKAGGASAFAEKHGINRSELSQCLHGHRPVSPGIAEALGYERRIVFVRPLCDADMFQGVFRDPPQA